VAERGPRVPAGETPYARSFDHVADVYDRVRPPFSERVVQQILASLDLDGSSTVLDLGAGTGG
jgi:ubiquinone/menaquinone biosynthesis C-methylase UbiE